MPSVSKKQHNFMAMCSSRKGRKAAKDDCPPMGVAKKFVILDKRKGKK